MGSGSGECRRGMREEGFRGVRGRGGFVDGGVVGWGCWLVGRVLMCCNESGSWCVCVCVCVCVLVLVRCGGRNRMFCTRYCLVWRKNSSSLLGIMLSNIKCSDRKWSGMLWWLSGHASNQRPHVISTPCILHTTPTPRHATTPRYARITNSSPSSTIIRPRPETFQRS